MRIRQYASVAVFTVIGLVGSVQVAKVAKADFVFSASDYSATGLGNPGGQFDQLTLTGQSGSFALAPGATTTITLSDLLFQVGSFAPQGTFNYDTSQSLTIDGVSHTLSQAFSVTSSEQDTLTILDGAPVQFSLPSGVLTVTPLGFGPASYGVGDHPGTLQARIDFSVVPEPASIITLGLGAIVMSAALRRRSAETSSGHA